jgi:hypothetical protein
VIQRVTSLSPEEIEELVAAYQEILRDLAVERSSPVGQVIAKEILDLAKQGVRNRRRLTEIVMQEFNDG